MTERLRIADQQPNKPAERPKAPICPFCKAANSPVDDRCIECGRPLNLERSLAELSRLQQFERDVVNGRIGEILERRRLTTVTVPKETIGVDGHAA